MQLLPTPDMMKKISESWSFVSGEAFGFKESNHYTFHSHENLMAVNGLIKFRKSSVSALTIYYCTICQLNHKSQTWSYRMNLSCRKSQSCNPAWKRLLWTSPAS